MPRLGEALEPAHFERIDPWWRSEDRISAQLRPDASETETLPKAMPWPIAWRSFGPPPGHALGTLARCDAGGIHPPL